MKLVSSIAAVVLTAAGVYASSTPLSAGASTASTRHICQVPNPNTANCLRDPSNGGSGTPIKMTSWSNTTTQHWHIRPDPQFCNGHGTIQNGCGLPSFIVSRYQGRPVVVFEEDAAAHCLKIPNMTSGTGLAEMGTCYDANTLLILGTCTNNLCYYVSISQSEAVGQILWICAGNLGAQPYAGAGSNCDASHWEYTTP